MKIKRQINAATIQHILQTGEIEIELTAEELRKAYLDEKHSYYLADAEAQFYDYFYRTFGSSCDDIAQERFLRNYGFTADEVEDAGSPHYLLEKFADVFEQHHDCNNADNDAWPAAIESVLEEYSKTLKHRCPRCGHALADSDLPDYTYLCTHCDENFYSFESVEVEQGNEPLHSKGGAAHEE